jgi:hypothetical protein
MRCFLVVVVVVVVTARHQRDDFRVEKSGGQKKNTDMHHIYKNVTPHTI